MADFYGASNGGSLWPDVQGETKLPTGSPEDMGAGDMPQGYMPMMPMVQPLIVVPYSGQMQPLSQYSPDGYGMPMDGGYDGYDNYENAPARTRGGNVSAILALLLSLITVALIVVSYFVDSLTFLNIIKGKGNNAIKLILGLFTAKSGGKLDIKELIVPIGLAVCVLFAALTFVTNLFSIKAQKYPIVGKIFALLSLVGAAIAVVMLFVGKKEIEIGAYVLAGLTAVTAIIALTGRRRA